MKESKYKGQLDRCEVESIIAPLRDKEPTPAWRKQFRDVLKHYGVTLKTLMHLAVISNKVNLLGRRYGEQSLQALLAHYNEKHNDWTKNGSRTINDHLDVLVDYLSKPEDNEPETECDHVPIFIERLEKAIDETRETNKVRVKRVRKNKKHKKHKSNNIFITIRIGR